MSHAHHVIRLRGAWTVTADGPRFRHARPFGWPAALDPRERVWLVVVGGGDVALNGVQLVPRSATGEQFEADITALLRPRNEILLTRDTAAQSLDVTLEVRDTNSVPA
ncbi:hypothetical protein [Urbifossiella limnaea]|uniref:hypothetical protein n=1 Tax=Urbifossiella limnaea TaxID=2528023 RepID=UPI0011A26E95|nr:hypothetical protein [Urbifossiella limnaea]